MSGIVTGINYGLLFSTDSSATDTVASMIATIYGQGSAPSGPSTFASTGNPLVDLKLAQKNEAASVAREAKQPLVTQAITAFKSAVANAKTIDSALGNPNVQKVLLTANGLSKYIGDVKLVQKALLSDPHDPKSLASQMHDYALLNTVLTYNFKQNGLKQLQDPKTIAALTSGYAEMTWRQSLEQATPGLSNALTFLEQASSIKSVDDVLTNMVNFLVVTTAFGIPQSIVNQPHTAQQHAIGARLNVADLQKPHFVTSLTDQYLLTMQEQKASGSGFGALQGLVV
jgi:hypothetical protein